MEQERAASLNFTKLLYVLGRRAATRYAAVESVMKVSTDLKGGKPDGAFIFPDDCNRNSTQRFGSPSERPVWQALAFMTWRHFPASQLIAQGEPTAYLRERMGHSSVKVTFDSYGHLFPCRGKEASQCRLIRAAWQLAL